MRTLSTLDRAIVARAERVAHAVQRWTGWDNLVLHKAALVLAAACILWRILLQAQTTGHLPGWWAFDVVIIAWLTGYVLFSHENEQEAEFRARCGLCNPCKIDSRAMLLRMIWLWIVCFGLAFIGLDPRDAVRWPNFGEALGFWLALLFDSCDPLPPCRGKVREWFDALGQKPVPASSEAGG